MAKIRTFIAVETPPEVRARAVTLIGHLAPTPANVRWVEEENLHWTVKFLGEVPSNDISEICDAVAGAIAELKPFEIEVAGAGAFPTAARPRTVWIGVSRGEPQFVELHDAIDAALGELGFRSENRRFRPHMTLGRVRRSPQGIRELADMMAGQSEFEAGKMQVDEVAVFASHLDRNGPRYQALAHLPLGK